MPIYVTENGFSDFIGNTDDLQRIYYYKHYINQLLKAVKLDGVDVRGYYAWSLMDNFEWAKGYSEQFGLHHVDFEDPERPRTSKMSSLFYKNLVANNGFAEELWHTYTKDNVINHFIFTLMILFYDFLYCHGLV